MNSLYEMTHKSNVNDDWCKYNDEAMIGLVFRMYRMDGYILLQAEGQDDIYIKPENIIIKASTFDKYYQFSYNDEFEQGHKCIIDSVSVAGVVYMINTTWKPHPFAIRPERIIVETVIGADEAQGSYYMWFDGEDEVYFINKDGVKFTRSLNHVDAFAGRAIMPKIWYLVSILESTSDRTIVMINNTKITLLRDVLL